MERSGEFDPLSNYFEQNPYKELRRMRETCRAYRHKGTLMPVVSFFHNDDIRPMLQDWKTWSSQRSEEYNEKALGDAAILIGNDPPLHTQYRDVVAPLFLPGAVNPLVPMIEEQTARVVDKCLGVGEINFVEDFAADATVSVICKLVGVPESDKRKMRDMTVAVGREDGRAVFWKKPNPETEARLASVMTEMTEYFTHHIDARQGKPVTDVLGHISEHITNRRHLIGMSILIVGAGNETTTNLMAHGLQELLRHPKQMEMLRKNPGLINGAIEEMLRYRGTIRKQDRIAAIDTEIDGVQINKGDSIALWNASASRDPKAIDRPEEFDITRERNRHLALGSGIHMCVGNALARLELRIAFQMLLEKTKEIRLTRGEESYESLGNGVLEAAKRLSVELIPA